MKPYAQFLADKAAISAEAGFPGVNAAHVNPILKPHQRDAVLWAVRGGRRAVFASFGLGKTVIQLEAVRLTMASVGERARGLIVCPLGVRQEFVRDARDLLGWDEEDLPRFVRSHEDAGSSGIYPLSLLPGEVREGIAERVAQPKPPPRWLTVGLGQIESRAWWEWHWQRGIDPEKRRHHIPDWLRQAVYERDGHACRHCGASEQLSLDHIHPFSLGGEDTLENLQTLCRSCNSKKGARV